MNITWKQAGDAAKYLPALNAAEQAKGIPPDLLARIAYQESHFRPDIISCTLNSTAGCKGLMQLNPVYFPHAGLDPFADISDAAGLLASNHNRFSDWQMAVAAYNWGSGNVHQWYVNGADPGRLPHETLAYVTQVNADVPIPGQIIKA